MTYEEQRSHTPIILIYITCLIWTVFSFQKHIERNNFKVEIVSPAPASSKASVSRSSPSSNPPVTLSCNSSRIYAPEELQECVRICASVASPSPPLLLKARNNHSKSLSSFVYSDRSYSFFPPSIIGNFLLNPSAVYCKTASGEQLQVWGETCVNFS